MAGFFTTASAQKLESRPRPVERRFDRIELRRIHRMECRHRRRRFISQSNTTNLQRAELVLYKAKENTTV